VTDSAQHRCRRYEFPRARAPGWIAPRRSRARARLASLPSHPGFRRAQRSGRDCRGVGKSLGLASRPTSWHISLDLTCAHKAEARAQRVVRERESCANAIQHAVADTPPTRCWSTSEAIKGTLSGCTSGNRSFVLTLVKVCLDLVGDSDQEQQSAAPMQTSLATSSLVRSTAVSSRAHAARADVRGAVPLAWFASASGQLRIVAQPGRAPVEPRGETVCAVLVEVSAAPGARVEWGTASPWISPAPAGRVAALPQSCSGGSF
jgi:hypothetical protein